MTKKLRKEMVEAEAFLILLTISHAHLEVPIRLTSDAVNTTSRGNSFIALPFEPVSPDDQESKTPNASLIINDIDGQVFQAVRNLTSSPNILIEFVRVTAPEVVKLQFVGSITSVNTFTDSQAVQLDLAIKDLPRPALRTRGGYVFADRKPSPAQRAGGYQKKRHLSEDILHNKGVRKMTIVRIDIWGGENSQIHEARYHCQMEESLGLARAEIRAGFLVNMLLVDKADIGQEFDQRLGKSK